MDYLEEEIYAADHNKRMLEPYMNREMNYRYPFGSRTPDELELDQILYPKVVSSQIFKNHLFFSKAYMHGIVVEGPVLRHEMIEIIELLEEEINDD